MILIYIPIGSFVLSVLEPPPSLLLAICLKCYVFCLMFGVWVNFVFLVFLGGCTAIWEHLYACEVKYYA